MAQREFGRCASRLASLGLIALCMVCSPVAAGCDITLSPGPANYQDDVRIHNALQQVGANGTVCLNAGNYYAGGAIWFTASHQTLRSTVMDQTWGSPNRASIRFKPPDYCNAAHPYDDIPRHIFLANGDHQTLAYIDIFSGLPPCNLWRRFTIHSRHSLIFVDGSSPYATVEYCSTDGTPGTAVMDVSGENSTIDHNSFSRAGYRNNPTGYWADGIRLHGNGHIVTNNLITNATDIAIPAWGSNITIADNTIVSDGTKTFAAINWGEPYTHNIIVKGNTIKTLHGGVISMAISVGYPVWGCGCDGHRTDATGTVIGDVADKNYFIGSGFGWLIALNGVDGIEVVPGGNDGSQAPTVVAGQADPCGTYSATAARYVVGGTWAQDLLTCPPGNNLGGVDPTNIGTGWTIVAPDLLRNLPSHPDPPGSENTCICRISGSGS